MKGWDKESLRHSAAKKFGKAPPYRGNRTIYSNKQLALNLPSHIAKGDLQWKGTVHGELIEIYYDDKASQTSNVNLYAVFSQKGFLGFLELGFAYPEIESFIKKYKYNPTDYYKELNIRGR